MLVDRLKEKLKANNADIDDSDSEEDRGGTTSISMIDYLRKVNGLSVAQAVSLGPQCNAGVNKLWQDGTNSQDDNGKFLPDIKKKRRFPLSSTVLSIAHRLATALDR